MNVAILTSSLDPIDGGWARYSREVAKGLAEHGHHVEVFVESASRVTEVEGITAYAGLKTGSNRMLRNLLTIFQDYFWLRSRVRDADVVHAFVEHHAFSASLLGKPFCITGHGTYLPRFLRDHVYGAWTRHVLKKASHIICGSEFTEKEILDILPGLSTTIFLPNGVNLTKFRPSKETQRNPLFITAGAVKSRKGQDIGIRAFAKLRDKYPNARYLIVGDQSGGFAREMRVLAKELGVERTVEFRDSIRDDELISIYDHALGYMLPSRIAEDGSFEGFPLSLLEAAACGLPVIGTYGCGAEHLIENGENGFLIHQEDIDALACDLGYLLEDPHRARLMGERARFAAERFSWDRYVSTLSGIYEAIPARMAAL